ncbi:MAG: hypothetical protein FWC91_07880 [Defluviitaleaceae bacterium]|nr:hypothetical protein [Defluviitaleaceae bacterium]
MYFWKRNKHNAFPVHTQSHVQKRYFSLMLVPSYTSGKTRSIRISYRTFYTVFFAIMATIAIISFLYLQSRFFRQVTADVSVSLEQAQVAYAYLQQATEQEQSELVEGVISLQYAINDERNRTQEEMLQRQDVFIETLESIWAYTESLEMRLRQYEEYRQEIIEQLSESAHLPVVSNVLNEMQISQMHLLSSLENLFDFSATSREEATEQTRTMFMSHSPDVSEVVSAEDATSSLIYYIAMLELALEAQQELYTQLQQQVGTLSPHIRRDRYGPDLLEWSHVRTILPQNTPIMITDVRTGITYWVKSFSHGNHADVFPVTSEDTAAMLRTYNGRWSWDTRPIWVHHNGRKIAASINGMPHATGSRNNNMTGHICIHFRGSRTHSGNRFHERDHQNSVMEAYRASF